MLEFRTETFDHNGKPCVRLIAECDDMVRTVDTAFGTNDRVSSDMMAKFMLLMQIGFKIHADRAAKKATNGKA